MAHPLLPTQVQHGRLAASSHRILAQDVFGLSFLGHLRARAAAGVTVRVLVDAQGRRMSRRHDRADCLSALAGRPGIALRSFRPLSRRLVDAALAFEPLAAIASTHDKLLLADGRRAIIGGRNVEARYFADEADLPVAFSDVDVLVDDPAAPAPAPTTARRSSMRPIARWTRWRLLELLTRLPSAPTLF